MTLAILEGLVFVALLLAAEDSPRGGIVEKIVCRKNPEQSYALYLPSAYAPDRRWPILYALDARGRALLPLERFREAAEEYGWILVSSFNSRSDTSNDPNTPALSAMWADTAERFALDPRRVYLTGFSGGARAAVNLALHSSEPIAGVIGCGAGFPDGVARVDDLPFPYFGTIGNRDFNYYEMRSLDEKLTAARVPHRIEIFDGGHDWPPTPLAGEALAWMEVRAAGSGKRSRDETDLAALYRRDLARAKALETEGRDTEVYLRYSRIVEDFRGLIETVEAAAKAAELGRSPAVQKSLKQARRRDERDVSTLGTLQQKLRNLLDATDLPLAGRAAAELGISGLRKKAASAESAEERLSAERILATLRSQTAFYLPQRFLEQNDYPRAQLVLSLAAQIAPEDPYIDYALAAAHARAGEKTRALRDLQRAVDKGFRDYESLDTDPDFAKVRDDSDFQRWLFQARSRKPEKGVRWRWKRALWRFSPPLWTGSRRASAGCRRPTPDCLPRRSSSGCCSKWPSASRTTTPTSIPSMPAKC